MAKEIKFNFTKDKTPWIEVKEGRRPDDDFTDGTPSIFDTDHDKHAIYDLYDMYGMLFPYGDISKTPIMYFRHTQKNYYRFGSFVKLGDTFLEPQKGAYYPEKLATSETEVTPYHKISSNPDTYEVSTKEPFSQFRFNADCSTWKEADFFSCTAYPTGQTLYDHNSIYPNLSEMFCPAYLTGMFDGKPFIGLGGYDNVFVLQGLKNDFVNLDYFYVNLMGIKEDDRKEQVVLQIFPSAMLVFGYYHIDGEEPIVSYEVSMEADWYHLPYTDDGTCVYKDAVFKFGGKEIHFEGKWGSKGFTPKPRVERHGQSQVFGTWYEGKDPYKHKLFLSFNENMEAYDCKLKTMGFDVVD